MIIVEQLFLEAKHSGVLKLGSFEIPCYVLDNEKRVLAQNKVVHLISGGRDSGDLGRYLRAKSIESLLPEKFRGDYKQNIVVFKAGQNEAYGLEATDVIDICNMYLTARQRGLLHPSQTKIAEMCEIFISACAKTGIEAVIDEATGYEYYKRANELQTKLQAYLQEGFRQWTLTFEKEFFLQLYKLEGSKPPMPLKTYPKRFGRYIMRYVYDTLDPDISDWLRKNNQHPEGKTHHHQKFNDFGYMKLKEHLMNIVGIQKASITMERFKENLAIAFPNARTQRLRRMRETGPVTRKSDQQIEMSFL